MTLRLLAVAGTAAGTGGVAVTGILLGAGPAVAAPLAASLALALATPATPAARPRAVLGGYALSVLAGIVATAVLGSVGPGPWWRDTAAVLLGAGLAVALMIGLDALHPPAAAAGCVVALHPLLHWPVPLVLLAAGASVACATALRSHRRSRSAASADQHLGDRHRRVGR